MSVCVCVCVSLYSVVLDLLRVVRRSKKCVCCDVIHPLLILLPNGSRLLIVHVSNGCIVNHCVCHVLYKMRCFETQEGLYDCAWNEMNENQV